jgi:hypothetical protein
LRGTVKKRSPTSLLSATSSSSFVFVTTAMTKCSLSIANQKACRTRDFGCTKVDTIITTPATQTSRSSPQSQGTRKVSPNGRSRAEVARTLYVTLSYPFWKVFKWIIQSNQIKDCPGTVEDADGALKTWGKNIAALKGKITRSKPIPVARDFVKVTQEIVGDSSQIQGSETVRVRLCDEMSTIFKIVRIEVTDQQNYILVRKRS